jgi:ADP-heptose:LPS heptosyltransferase
MLRLRGRPFFHLLRRPIYRWRRFLLFRFHWNLFEKPFSGQMDQLRPLKKWGVIPRIGETPSLFIAPEVLGRIKDLLKQREVGPFVALAPSAAYPLKRWPREYFEELMKRMPSFSFVLLGGPEDTFLEEMAVKGNEGLGPARVFNLAGKLSLEESAAVVFYSRALVANDTGVMHMAEQLGRPCVALMGPAPFGFPSKKSTRILERDLSCRPCSKHGQGPCVNPEYQKCLRTILPVEVKRALEDLL